MKLGESLLHAAAILCLFSQIPYSSAQLRTLPVEADDVQEDPGAPRARIFLRTDPSQPNSCYHTAQVALVPHSPPGFWTLRAQLPTPEALFEGGLNFGGAIAANGRGQAYARFRIDNPGQTPQWVSLTVDAQFIPAYDPSRIGFEVRIFQVLPDDTLLEIGEAHSSQPVPGPAFRRIQIQEILPPGRYVTTIKSLKGSTWGTFQAWLATGLAGAPGGGFSGGLEVGGYLRQAEDGRSLLGYAGFCLGTSRTVELTTLRQDTIGNLILRVFDGDNNILYDSSATPDPVETSTTTSISTTSTTIAYSRGSLGVGNVGIRFDPNPSVDPGTGRHVYRMILSETNGVGIRFTTLSVGGFSKDVDAFLGTVRLEPFQSVSTSLQYLPATPISSPIDRDWEINGADDEGHRNLVWRGSVRLVPAGSQPYAHLRMNFLPHPAFPDDEGSRPFTLRLEETNGVGLTLTGLSLSGEPISDFRTLLGGDRLEPYGVIETDLRWSSDTSAGEYAWIFTGKDDHQHTNQQWTAYQSLAEHVPLVDAEWQDHQAYSLGLMPFQFTAFVPAAATRMVLELEPGSEPLTRQEVFQPGFLNVYVRIGEPVEDPGGSGLAPVADYALRMASSGALVIDTVSSPPLRAGSTYYVAVANSLTGVPVSFRLRASYVRPPVIPTTTTSSTTVRTTTTTSTTRIATTTSTTRPPATTTPSTTITTTTARPSTTTTVRPTTTTSASTTTTLPGSFQYGSSKVYPVQVTAGGTVSDSVTGLTFAFPDGGSGSLTVARTLSGPGVQPYQLGFRAAYSGAQPVYLRLHVSDPQQVHLFGYFDNRYVHASPTPKPGESSWCTLPAASSGSGVLSYRLPLARSSTAVRPDEQSPAGGASAGDFKVEIAGGSYPIPLPPVPPEVLAAYAKYGSMKKDFQERLSKFFTAPLKARVLAAPPVSVVVDSGISVEHYQSSVWSVWSVEYTHEIYLKPGSDAATFFHEYGHYLHNVVLGDAEYYKLDSRPEGHSIGDPGCSAILSEEPAFFAVSLAYHLGSLTEFSVPTGGDYVGKNLPHRKPPDDPLKANYPDLEGFVYHVLSELVRRESKIQPFAGAMCSGGDCLDVPVIDVSDLNALYLSIYDIIADPVRFANAYTVRDAVEGMLQKMGTQGWKLPPILQGIGWNYPVSLKFVDDRGAALQGFYAQAVVKGPRPGEEYVLPIGHSASQTTSSVTTQDGTYVLDWCFGGDSTVIRINGTMDFTGKISIPWKEPANVLHKVGDVALVKNYTLTLKDRYGLTLWNEPLEFDLALNGSVLGPVGSTVKTGKEKDTTYYVSVSPPGSQRKLRLRLSGSFTITPSKTSWTRNGHRYELKDPELVTFTMVDMYNHTGEFDEEFELGDGRELSLMQVYFTLEEDGRRVPMQDPLGIRVGEVVFYYPDATGSVSGGSMVHPNDGEGILSYGRRMTVPRNR